MKQTIVFLAATLLCWAPARANAQDQIGRMPWHLVDYWFEFEREVEFKSYSVDVTIDRPVDDLVKLYIAPVGIGRLSGGPFYGGIQTMSDGYREGARRKSYIGRGAIFSRWDERDTAAVRRAPGGLIESAGYEGDFVSVRNSFEWTTGTYTWEVRAVDTETINEKEYSWVGCFARDHRKTTETFVGALRFEGAPLTMDPRVAAFLEIYGARVPLDRIPKVSVTFGNWMINGKPVTPGKITAYYPLDVPQYATSKMTEHGVVGTLGTPIDRDPLRYRKTDQAYYERLDPSALQ